MKHKSSNASLLCTVAALLAAAGPLHAGLVLTQAGVDLGFSLTTFANGFNAQYGPLAEGIAPNGRVVSGSLLNQRIYVFNDVDGQTLVSAVTSVPYTCETSNCNFAMATAGGEVYGAQAAGGIFYHFAGDGTFTPIPNLVAAGLRGNFGIWGDPVNGHLIAASNKGLVDIDPVAGTFRVINASLFPDGVSVSPDGTVAYVANGSVQGYSIATGALLDSFAVAGGPDGMGVISGGGLSGDIVSNNNNGTVTLLDPTKAVGDPARIVIIASGGTRGDFVSADTSNGTLFLSQNEQVARLSCGPGCSIGSVGGGGGEGAPEPATFALFGAGLTALLVKRRKSRVESTK